MNDSELKSLIKSHMRQDKGNPYFVRKVLNRLPDKEHSQRPNWILRVAWLASALILGGMWVDFIISPSPFAFGYFFLLWAATIISTLVSLRDIVFRGK